MGARFRSWWQKIKQYRVTILVVTIILIIAIVLIIAGYWLDWTGFNGNNKSSKTLWDWLNLLGILAVPVVVGFGAVWFTTRQGKVADAENTDNQRETALQAYIDKMSELLLEKHLRASQPDDEVCKIARVRTLTILPRLDANRKRTILKFLFEASLIDRDERIVDLRGADLSYVYILEPYRRDKNLRFNDLNFFHTALMREIESKMNRIDLSEANLRNANLRGADMIEADLSGASLQEANLSGADLHDADLRGINLTYANLNGANLSGADLRKANLVGAKLTFTNLSGADLRETILTGATLYDAELSDADMSGADMSALMEADLSETKVTEEQLNQAKSLKGATMPDGSIHP